MDSDDDEVPFSSANGVDKSNKKGVPKVSGDSEDAALSNRSMILSRERILSMVSGPQGSNADDGSDDEEEEMYRNRRSLNRINNSTNVAQNDTTAPAPMPPRREDSALDTAKVKRGVVKSSPSTECESGAAKDLTDEALILMLRQPPKSIPLLRTKTGFQDFFRGTSSVRMKQLLTAAYSNMNELDREQKVKKRMELLVDVLV